MRWLTVALIGVLVAGCQSGGDPAPPTTVTATATGEPTPSSEPSPPADPEPGPRDSSLDLPLIDAAAAGDAAAVQDLLNRGASVRATDQNGRTPLTAAAYGNHVAVAEILLAAGAEPNEKDRTVQSPYLISTSEIGDDPALLDLLLGAGADVSSRDSFNGTGLIRAADRGFPRIIERLLVTDIEVNHVNRLGWTALHEAIVLGDGGPQYVEVVQLLVAAGADVNLEGNGRSPLQHATDRGYTGIAEVLRAAGAQP